jgi:hypothetical protein
MISLGWMFRTRMNVRGRMIHIFRRGELIGKRIVDVMEHLRERKGVSSSSMGGLCGLVLETLRDGGKFA